MEHNHQTQLTRDPQESAADGGLSVRRYFTTPGEDPFHGVEWELRDARIGHGEKVAFEQRDVEFPKSWSQNATNIVAQKYFRGQPGSPERERSVRQMIKRVAGTVASWGAERGYFASDADSVTFEAELTHILLNQMAAFNSPVWFNVGWHPVGSPKMQASACFILSVEDNMESILEWNTKEGIIFRGGSGSGINLSKIRGSHEPLSRGGTASGPVSFMRGADAWAGSIKSGGGTRRAAKMVVLDIDHPDIREFIWCKAKEEDKAAALRAAGFDMSLDGDGFHSIQYQNANNSVRLTDEFMRAVENDDEWRLVSRTTGEPTGEPIPARQLMQEISEAAWRCADPGVQYDSTINAWHTCPNSGRINASNPCFPGDARVHTDKGLIPIHELVARGEAGERIRVYTHRATAQEPGAGVVATQPVAFMRNGVSPIVRLRFANGANLRCTPNHRLWTLNRGYVRAEDLTAEDDVMLNDSPTPAEAGNWELPTEVTASAKSFHRGGSVTYQKLPRRWSEGLGELTGHLIGDGCLTCDQAQWIYGGDDIEDGLADSHAGMLAELIGRVSRQEMSNGSTQLRAGSMAVREFFRGLGVTSARAHEKRVPQTIFTAPQPVQAAFLRGLFGADGCVSRVESGGKAHRYVGLGSRSEALLRDVQILLSAFGVHGRIYRISEAATPSFSYTHTDGTKVVYESRQGYDLRITGSDLERFADTVGFSTPRKHAALAALLGETRRYATKGATRLLAREEDGQEHVFNLTEPLHHSYIVDGFVVANCSEYMHVDDSACNLASLNLMKFRRPDGTLDVESFEHAVDIIFLAQEIIVSPSSYPTEKIAENARAFRQLGMGYSNLGAYLMANGLPYDSDEGRATAAAITALMTGRGYLGSARTAEAIGPYERYAENRNAHNAVMRKHREAAYGIDASACADADLLAAARSTWDAAVAAGEQHGYRNAQATVLAPCGTISFMMDNDTTGVEPDFSLVKYKELVGGGQMKIVNRTVPLALKTLGYSEPQIEQILAYVNEHGTILGAPELAEEHLPVFDVAVGERAISHMGHIKMMAAVQPLISGAISKTVNLPETATVLDIADAYIQGWKLGIKALAIYRDGSKTAQVLGNSAQEDAPAPAPSQEQIDALVEDAVQKAVADALAQAPPQRRRMPRERQSITHKFSIGGHEGYITAGMYEDGTVGEIFLTDIGKEGSTLRGMMNSFATAISISLQYGVPLETLVRKFSYMRFEPEGMTSNPEIPFAKSMPDYIMRWLASRFLDVDLQEELGILTPDVRARRAAQEAASAFRGDTAAPASARTGSDGDAGSPDQDAPRENGGNGTRRGGEEKRPAARVRAGTHSVLPSLAFTDTPPVAPPAGLGAALDLGPACQQCGGMMQRTGSCYTCSSCGFNTGCG
jgi:ribonucleoside-diphosphate reductase alpha chain